MFCYSWRDCAMTKLKFENCLGWLRKSTQCLGLLCFWRRFSSTYAFDKVCVVAQEVEFRHRRFFKLKVWINVSLTALNLIANPGQR